MGKFLTYLFAVLIILLGIPNITFCLSFINDKTIVRGSPNDLEKEELPAEYGYKITYNLNDGILPEENKTIYGLFTADFTLNNPTKEGYEFIGWTGSNGDTPQIRVTICSGSSGDLEFTANYALILETPKVDISGTVISWNAVENANSYAINVNGENVQSTTNLSFDLLNIKEHCHAGANVIKVQALNITPSYTTTSDFSDAKYFNVTQLETPTVSLNGFNIAWNAIENAKQYTVSIGAYTITTTETTVNLLNHLDWMGATETSIRVKAVASKTSLEIDSKNSETVKFVKPTLDAFKLSLTKEAITWDYDTNVECYDIYINSTKVLTVTDKSSISLDELSSYFAEGLNYIYIISSAKGYNSAKSNSMSYFYYDLTQFENLALNDISFSKTSSGYIVKYNTDAVVVNYNFSGVNTGGFVADSLNDDSLTLEQILLKCINPKKEISNLKLNVSSLELLEFISNSYEEDKTEQTLSVANLFKFLVADQFTTEYFPQKLNLTVSYEEMFKESSFYEGCIVSLNDCYSTNAFEFANAQGLDENSKWEKWVNCNIRINNDLYPKGLEYSYTTSKGTGYYYINSISNTSSVSENEFNNYLKDCKFYLNDNYYLKIKGNFSDFYKALFNKVCTLRNNESSTTESYNWSYDRITYTIDITEYFNAYSLDGVLVNFNYTLTADCITARTI